VVYVRKLSSYALILIVTTGLAYNEMELESTEKI
jgi:hypothetical protein